MALDLLYIGKKIPCTLPSTRKIIMRETNGNDDDTLSNLASAADGDNIDNFLANIVLEDSEIKGKPLVSDINRWHVNDKYYALFKQRLINHGDLLTFTKTCRNEKCRKITEFSQDLTEFDWLPEVSKDSENKSKEGIRQSIRTGIRGEDLFRIRPYKLGLAREVTMTTSSNKNIRYKILTGELERRELDMPRGNASKNTKLLIRELEIFNKNEWELVTQFGMFSSKELSEIRKHVNENDDRFDPAISTVCEYCKNPELVSLFSIPAFYFPEEVI